MSTSSAPVLLINMPFGGVDRPAIGISTLKAGLISRGQRCDVRYLNFNFARLVGPKLYQWFSDRASHMIFAGEWLFAKEFFGNAVPPESEYYAYLRSERGVPEQTIDAIKRMRQLVPAFLAHCQRAISWDEYRIVGFTSTFEQNVPSLALAHAIKVEHPDILIVFGGANCDGSMGVALHERFPFVDVVFTGAADHTFPEFVERTLEGRSTLDIPGVVHRVKGKTCPGPAAIASEALDALPIPDYDDYFAQLEGTGIPEETPVRLQIETSRGCWWGMKHHCTFCGMNASTMKFRSKSKERVIRELSVMVSRYGIRGIDAVDAIMDMEYFRTLLPALRELSLNLNLFYEIKANLTKEQVRLLAQAGIIFIQPGIESFSTKLLTAMRKGTTALQNVQLLKWCAEFGIEPTWNLLYGFPGEATSDYAHQLQLLSGLTHLQPPRGCGRLRMDRFSPHFDNAEEFGFSNVRPLGSYAYIYPFSTADTAELAYFFDYDSPNAAGVPDVRQIEEFLTRWRECHYRGARLFVYDDGVVSVIRDQRTQRMSEDTALSGWQRLVYRHCDQMRTIQGITRYLTGMGVTAEPTINELMEFLATMVRRQLIITDEGWYLAVAVEALSTVKRSDVSVLEGGLLARE